MNFTADTSQLLVQLCASLCRIIVNNLKMFDLNASCSLLSVKSDLIYFYVIYV